MTFRDRTPEIRAGRLLDVIREEPVLHLGERSLTALWHFLHGFVCAAYSHKIEIVDPLPSDFHEWVAYRLHYYESAKGWRRMILEQAVDESAALDRFYQLLDDHRARLGRVVATINGNKVEYRTHMQGQEPSEAIHRFMPEKMKLVAYTDDPGLFLTGEESVAFPGKDRLFKPRLSRFIREMITIVDQAAFDRWREEDERCGSSNWTGANKLFR